MNAIPPRAVAACQIRYTVDVHPNDLIPALRKHLDSHGFSSVRVQPWDKGFYAATRLDPEHPYACWASASIECTTGRKPAMLPNLGGSLPNGFHGCPLSLPLLCYRAVSCGSV